MRRALISSFLLLAPAGCYAAHERADAGRPPDARPSDAPNPVLIDATSDAAIPPARCASLTASQGRLLTHPSPNDFSLGSLQATGPTTALMAFTSSNDPSEMDVGRWVLPLDLDTGAPLAPDRITVFGEPIGLTYSAHSRVIAGPRAIFAYTWSEGQGCLRRRLNALGAFVGPELHDDDGRCLSARVAPSGELVFYRREAFERSAGYFERIDDEGRQTSVTGIGPTALELRDLRFTWAFNADGTIEILASDTLGTRFATWPELRWRNVEGAGQGASIRLVNVGNRLLGAWISESGEIELAYADEARVHRTGIAAVRAASIDVMPRGDELWLAFDQGTTHADARATLARLSLDLVEHAPRTEVGTESFVGSLRLLSSPRGALLVSEGQRADAAGGTNLFAIPIACVSEATRPVGCAAWRATVDRCTPPCDSIPSYVWDGALCVESQCGCTGPDCAFAYRERSACVADHATCAPSRCESTGGVWLTQNRIYCDSPVCGLDRGSCDEMPDAVCHCGLNALYDARNGCVTSFCAGTESSDQLRCERSGGTWGTHCTHSHCGEAPDPCVAMACRCADNEVWSEVAGCVVSASCERCIGE